MTKHIRYFFLLSLVALVFSCKKQTPENIVLPILPGGDLLDAQFTDTVTLIAHTVKDDSVPTRSSSPMLLGEMNDPIFGVTKSSIYTQFIPAHANYPSGTNRQIDSAVLSLVYYPVNTKYYYGRLAPQKFNVYELDGNMSTTAHYYSDTSIAYSNQIGSAYLTRNVKDSSKVEGGKYSRQLRIPLDTNYCKRFILDSSYTVTYPKNALFQTVFKGIYVTTASGSPSGNGAILNIDITNVYTRLTVYYHTSTDTLSYYLGITAADCARFTHFEHDYSNATEIKKQLSTSADVQEDIVYVQPMAGVRTKITMPHIMDFFKDQKVAINKAELILPVDVSSFAGADSVFSAHPKLVATIADSAIGPAIMPDFYEGAAYFGGEYDATNHVYKFNIARYLQQVLDGGRKNQGIYLLANGRQTSANRVVLFGGNAANLSHMRLKVTYTPLNVRHTAPVSPVQKPTTKPVVSGKE